MRTKQLVLGITSSVSPSDFPASGHFCSTAGDFINCIETGQTPAMYQATFERGEKWWILARAESGSLCLVSNHSTLYGFSPAQCLRYFESQVAHEQLNEKQFSDFLCRTFPRQGN